MSEKPTVHLKAKAIVLTVKKTPLLNTGFSTLKSHFFVVIRRQMETQAVPFTSCKWLLLCSTLFFLLLSTFVSLIKAEDEEPILRFAICN